MLCFRRALAEGFWSGLASGLGAAGADALYAAVAAFGLTFVSDFLIAHRTGFMLGASLFLVWLGVHMFRARPPRTPVAMRASGLAQASGVDPAADPRQSDDDPLVSRDLCGPRAHRHLPRTLRRRLRWCWASFSARRCGGSSCAGWRRASAAGTGQFVAGHRQCLRRCLLPAPTSAQGVADGLRSVQRGEPLVSLPGFKQFAHPAIVGHRAIDAAAGGHADTGSEFVQRQPQGSVRAVRRSQADGGVVDQAAGERPGKPVETENAREDLPPGLRAAWADHRDAGGGLVLDDAPVQGQEAACLGAALLQRLHRSRMPSLAKAASSRLSRIARQPGQHLVAEKALHGPSLGNELFAGV